MSDTSIDGILSELYRNNSNFLGLIDAMQESIDSRDRFIEFTWVDNNGIESTKRYPSIVSLLEKINSIEKSNEEAFNYKNNQISVKTHGGEIRRFIISEPLQSPERFSLTQSISRFNIKENFIKDKFIEPYTCISVPINEEIYPNFNKFEYSKMEILSDNTSINLFDQHFLDKSVSHADALRIMAENNLSISYSRGIVEMSPKALLNIGKFSVISIEHDANDDIFYVLSTTKYRDINMRDLSLKAGDSLIVSRNTKYEITRIIESERKIYVKLTDGVSPIYKGIDNLVLASSKSDNNIDVPIGTENRFVLFIRPINPITGVVNNAWGDGVGVYINSLKTDDGTLYDDSFSSNLWDKLKALSESKISPAEKILKPRIPAIKDSYFSVEMINSHKKMGSSIDRLVSLQAKKESENSKVESLNVSLNTIREKLSSIELSQNDVKRLKADELKVLDSNIIITKSLKNISNEIVELTNTHKEFKPKYAIVGIVPFTEPVYMDSINKTGRQDIIAYELEYRYLSKDGGIEEFKNSNISDTEESINFIASKWVKHEQIFRKRNEENQFTDEILSDPNVIKPNQYNIPISSNEIVEIRIRGLSESGYPMKEIYGDWSEIVSIPFPQELEKNIDNVVEAGKNEKIFNEFVNELSRQKLVGHASDSFENKDVSFKHHALNIATDEKTPEQGNLSVQAVLNLLKLDVNAIKQILSAQDGQIKVRIIDADDNEIAVVKNNTIIPIAGGLYSELVKNMDIKKGSIVDQTYFIEIENVGDGELELISYVTGKDINPLKDGYDGYVYNPVEYDNYRKYDKVPMSVLDINPIDYNDFTFGRNNQSKQVQGQVLYSRFRDMTLSNEMYVEDSAGHVGVISAGSGQTHPFLWNGAQTVGGTISGNGNYSDFCVHIKHPMLDVNSELMTNFSMYNIAGFIPTKNYDSQTSRYITPPFYHSKYASLNTNDVGYEKQLYSRDFTKVTSGATLSDQIFKNGFEEYDRYLIGKATCGTYFSVGATNRNSMEVENNSYNTGEKILKGGKKLIPIRASSRLTDYFGADDSGTGNIGGVSGATNVKYEKQIGIDILYKHRNSSELFSFDIRYSIQYQNGNL